MAVQPDEVIRAEAVTPARALTPEQKRRMVREPGNKAAHRIVFFRRLTQLTLFGLFVLFFFMTTVSSQHVGWVPKNLFMTLDFLNTLKNAIASHHVAIYALGPGLLILLLTLWGGRIFCGWICPLGTAIDISDRLLYRKGRLFYNRRRSETRRFRNWKYIYLLVGLGALAYGVDVLTFGDPLSLITRTFTFCFYAPIAYVWNGILSVTDAIGVSRLLYRFAGIELDGMHVPAMTFYNAVPVLIVFVGVIALSAVQERFWCRNLCPYGGLLALISRVGCLRHYIKMDGCIHCKKCEIQSRMGSYENLERNARAPAQHSMSECIQCFRCETICPPDVIQIQARVPAAVKERLGLAKPGALARPEPQNAIDLGRRRVVAALGAGLVWGATARASADNYQGRMRRYPRNNRAMRPPGALDERAFLSACTRCAECMKVCPTNALQPAFLETGVEGIWTPILVPSIGPCAEKCTACGDVCPTHAIRPFSWQDKRYKLKLGLANVNQSTCIAWNGGRDCVVCAEVCPYSAVVFRDKFDDGLAKDPTRPITDPGNKGRTKRVPTVDEKLCTGCGICEYHCPVLPDHSIVVYTFQEDREYDAPSETPMDGFFRRNWTQRKEAGKTAEYAETVEEFRKRVEVQGPGAPPMPGSGL
ncbi:MAG: 4Fe-4S binding protein [Chthonomonadales bacterium]|nr:4Fe-4S binding protein [Chthonomonadales bacterium]